MPITMLGLFQTATVYSESDAGFDVLVKSDLRCRILSINLRRLASTGYERSELEQRVDFVWEPTFVLNERHQIEVDGIRWTPVTGSFFPYYGPSNELVYRRCDLVRATVPPTTSIT